MNSVKSTQSFIIKVVIIVDLFLIGLSFILLKEPMPMIMGLIFGSAISVLNFIELANTLNRAVNMPADKAQTFTTVQ